MGFAMLANFSLQPFLAKRAWYLELWVCRCPNKHKNAIYDMKYAIKK
jgi:hypothetical protein